MEEEAREISKAGLISKSVPKLNLAQLIRRHITPLGGVELSLPQREAIRHHLNFQNDYS